MSRSRHLLEETPQSLAAHLDLTGQAPYRAEQILGWAFRLYRSNFESMLNLPKSLRLQLADEFMVRAGRELHRSTAPDGTVKILVSWPDAATTESVMIPAISPSNRRTACVSSQVGCDVGCKFCASGIGGALRNLSIGEILEQALILSELLAERGERLSHVVFMGMGEPLANYDATVEAVRRLTAPWGLGIGQRRITVSTVGLPKQIEQLSEEGLQITLAVSLHAPNDELRKDLIPWAKGVDLGDLLEACRVYLHRTGRQVTLEYCLLEEVNDQERHARQLAQIARDLRANVNLLMYNPVAELGFSRPSRNRAVGFLKQLRARGASAHLRESRGVEADAACGQLRYRKAVEE